MGMLMTRVAPRGFTPTPAQQVYAERLMEPGGSTLPEIATRVGVSPEVMLGWYDDPNFVGWLRVQHERLVEPLIQSLWQRIYQDAMEHTSAKVRLEAACLFLGRFDPGCRASDRD